MSLGQGAGDSEILFYSLSVYPVGKLVEIGKSDNCFWPATVLAAEVGYALILLTSLIEVVVRGILSVIALFILSVIPHSYRNIREIIVMTTMAGTLVNLCNAVVVACALFENLIRCGNVDNYDSFYCAHACNKFMKLGFRWLEVSFLTPSAAPGAQPNSLERKS